MIFRISYRFRKEKTCKLCGKKSKTISEIIGVCSDCLRNNPNEALKIAMKGHEISRGKFGLPPEPPRDPKGIQCTLCANNCRIPEGGKGFCGLVENRNGKLVRLAGAPDRGLLEWYYDPLPTNCVADWICPGCTGRGYPKWAYTKGPEYGFNNLAVFYGACNLDCLFCQNWQYRYLTAKLEPIFSAEDLAKLVNERVSCVCYFGGDPSPQMPHALYASKLMLEKTRGRIFRVCWESNGLMNPNILDKAVELSLISGGNFKFDIKAWTPSIYKALTGVDNKQLFENIKRAAKRIGERRDPPLIIASTLLVPGYVDEEEVRMIAGFLADIDPTIPYRLLAFHPDYLMDDLPPTSRSHMMKCLEAAKKEGLENISIGNPWLLGDYY